MSLETSFDIAFVASLALREKQIQQVYRPYVAVHKWFARRPGSLFRSLVLSEFSEEPLAQSYWRGHDFAGKLVADPFMGGGTPVIEANRLGCDVIGVDVNPMATWVCREAVEHLDLQKYAAAASDLIASLRTTIGDLYVTDCAIYGDKGVPAKSFLWVKVMDCVACGSEVDLFPGYLLAENKRHPLNVVVCHHCGDLNEVQETKRLGECQSCNQTLRLDGPAKRGKCPCSSCGHVNSFGKGAETAPRHRLFAIEYFNPKRKALHSGRFFKKPDERDLQAVAEARARFDSIDPMFVPEDDILAGDETDRLHRWGYRRYRDMFSTRQLLALEHSARLIAQISDARVRNALATNLSDLLRYQNMLCRYDTMALKSLDIFSVHGFPVGLVQCESNFLGIQNPAGTLVGSGGWLNIVEKYRSAKAYCDAPFEVQPGSKGKKAQVAVQGEWIGERRNGSRSRDVSISCMSSTDLVLAPAILDACFTDPPYFGMVQYGELMEFCYVWLRKLAADDSEGFAAGSARSLKEVTGNSTNGRDLARFTEGLSAVYQRIAVALKPGAPLAFTFHHNKIESYASVAVAILDAGLKCTTTLPCPAEMAGSIHISGTGSSIVDTVFVCRKDAAEPSIAHFADPSVLAGIVSEDLRCLRDGGVRPTPGDVRCIVFGHLARMAIWNLSDGWLDALPTQEKLNIVMRQMQELGTLNEVLPYLTAVPSIPAAMTLTSERSLEVSDALSV